MKTDFVSPTPVRRLWIVHFVVLATAIAILCAASATGGYTWSLLNWREPSDKAIDVLTDRNAAMSARMDALVYLQRTSTRHLAEIRSIALDTTDPLHARSAIAARNIENAGR